MDPDLKWTQEVPKSMSQEGHIPVEGSVSVAFIPAQPSGVGLGVGVLP